MWEIVQICPLIMLIINHDNNHDQYPESVPKYILYHCAVQIFTILQILQDLNWSAVLNIYDANIIKEVLLDPLGKKIQNPIPKKSYVVTT